MAKKKEEPPKENKKQANPAKPKLREIKVDPDQSTEVRPLNSPTPPQSQQPFTAQAAPQRPPPSAIQATPQRPPPSAARGSPGPTRSISAPVTKAVDKAVQVTCSKCKWLYSSRNETCPMCGSPIMLGEEDLVKILIEYVDRQGIFIELKQSREFIKTYKKNYKKLPSLDDLWNASAQLAKLEAMSDDQIKKMEQKKKEKEKTVDVEAEMQRLKQKKLQEKAKIETEARQKEEAKHKAEEEVRRKELEAKAKQAATTLVCKKCGAENPGDSKFCLECGAKLD
jgi:RNA polymerase subunit RPABC4/transcription elongation factor Spt4